MIHLWEYDSRRVNGVHMPQLMSELEKIGNEGWELILMKDDLNEEGTVTAIFKRQKQETISL